MVSAAGSVDGQAFAAQFIGQGEGVGYIRGRCRRREIDCFGYPAVTMSLKDGLHSDVMCRSDIVGGHKQPTKIIGELGQVLNRFMPTDFFP